MEGAGFERSFAVADALCLDRPVDTVKGGVIVGLDDRGAARAAVDVLLAIFAPRAVGLPALNGFDVGFTQRAPCRGADFQVGRAVALPPKDAVPPVPRLRGGMAKLRVEVDFFVAVTEAVHGAEPGVVGFPAFDIDDVLDDDQLIAVAFGEADHIPHRRAGAFVGGVDLNFAVEFELALIFAFASTGEAVRGAFGAGDEDIGGAVAEGVARLDVGAVVIDLRVVGVVALDGECPVVEGDDAFEAQRFGGDGVAAGSAELIVEGDRGGMLFG